MRLTLFLIVEMLLHDFLMTFHTSTDLFLHLIAEQDFVSGQGQVCPGRVAVEDNVF